MGNGLSLREGQFVIQFLFNYLNITYPVCDIYEIATQQVYIINYPPYKIFFKKKVNAPCASYFKVSCTSRFAHLEKFSLKFSTSWFVTRAVNPRHPCFVVLYFLFLFAGFLSEQTTIVQPLLNGHPRRNG